MRRWNLILILINWLAKGSWFVKIMCVYQPTLTVKSVKSYGRRRGIGDALWGEIDT